MVGRFPGSTPAGVSTSAGRLGWRPVWIVVSRKRKQNRRITARRRKLEQQEAVAFRRAPQPRSIAWVCTDPACLEGIHHLGPGAEEPAPRQRTTPRSNEGPFSDPSDLDSEAAGGQHDTPPT
jgi:hypothetical protein